MPIRRIYACPECNHRLEVTLRMDQADDPPPLCPRCVAWDGKMQQEFKPPGIIGSNRYKATKLAEDIAANDYHVADMQGPQRAGDLRKVRYKDQPIANTSTWGVAQEALSSAISAGREVRLQHGSGLDVLQANIKSGAEPDLIAISKRRSMKVW